MSTHLKEKKKKTFKTYNKGLSVIVLLTIFNRALKMLNFFCPSVPGRDVFLSSVSQVLLSCPRPRLSPLT
jgi:hypothetical protein